MSSLYVCAGAVVCSLIICSLVRLLIPSGNTAKIMTIVIGVFAMLCLVTPIGELADELGELMKQESNFSISENVSEAYDEKVLEQTAEYISVYLYELLDAESVEVRNITTSVSLSESKGIYVREVCIYIDSKSSENTPRIQELVQSAVMIEPLIMVI